MKRLLFWLSVGALIAWFADPVSGAERRKAVNDLANRGGVGGPSDVSTV
ncbi:MAG: hypothetical protein WD225_01925 [Ilumatobacteraceae bacterium]